MPGSDEPVTGPVSVSVIVPAWRLVAQLGDCLDSLAAQQDAPRFEVVVVVNGADPDVVKLAQDHAITKTVLPIEFNCGFGWACNYGATTAAGEYLAFLNDDAVVEPNWLAQLHRCLAAQGAGAVGSLLLEGDGRIAEAGGRILPNGDTMAFGTGLDPATAPQFLVAREVDYCSMAAMLVGAADFRRLGGFDSVFEPAYYEDVDFELRLREAGQAIWFEPAARVHHQPSQSTADRALFRSFASEHAREAFLARWAPVLAHAQAATAPIGDLLPVPARTRAVTPLAEITSQTLARAAARIQGAYAAYLESQTTTLAQLADLQHQVADLERQVLSWKRAALVEWAQAKEPVTTDVEAEAMRQTLSWRVTEPMRRARPAVAQVARLAGIRR